jgi:CheY-like chemotaxis protein
MPTPTILVVDDESLIRWSLAERLRSEGYHVLDAETGREALDRLRDGVDLVLLDYKLPDIDGVTVLRKIK